MDEPIFDPVTYALLKSQIDSDSGKIAELNGLVEERLPGTAISDLNELGEGDPILGFFSNTSSNTPAASAGLVLHFASSSNYAVQFACLVGANGLYTRGKSSGTWGAWKQITAT